MNQFKDLSSGRELTAITFAGRCPTDLQPFFVTYNRRMMPDGSVMFDSQSLYGQPQHRECVVKLGIQRGAYGQVK